MTRKRDSLHILLLAATFFTLASGSAHANVAIPTLVFVWPLSWIAFLPIVAIEAVVAVRLFRLPWGISFKSCLEANALSTLVGLPVTWVLLFAVNVPILEKTEALSGSRIVGLVLSSPWALADGMPDWALFAGTACLLPFFWVMSVFVERPVFRKVSGCDKQGARSWSWKANSITYGLIVVAVLTGLAFTIIKELH